MTYGRDMENNLQNVHSVKLLAMARSREFDPKVAVEEAMKVFWKKGYVDTSIEDLVEATGVSRYGLYGEFGSKRGLFLASLDHYQETAIREYFGVIERPGAGLREIRIYCEQLVEIYSHPAGKLGCLVCNTATEVAPHDKGVEKKIKFAIERMTAGIRAALMNSKNRGEVRPDLDVGQAADFLTGALLGASVMARSGASNHMIKNTIEKSLASL